MEANDFRDIRLNIRKFMLYLPGYSVDNMDKTIYKTNINIKRLIK